MSRIRLAENLARKRLTPTVDLLGVQIFADVNVTEEAQTRNEEHPEIRTRCLPTARTKECVVKWRFHMDHPTYDRLYGSRPSMMPTIATLG